MRKILSVLLVLVMILSLTACSSGNTATTAPTQQATTAAEGTTPATSGEGITIGTISPNTGSLAAYGAAVTTGVELAFEQINAAGGVNGQQVTIINADDQFDPTECLNAFNSLVSQGVNLIIGSVTSGCTSAITDAANEEGVVLLTPSATADSITTKDDYVFRACYADSFQGAIAAYYAKQAGYTDVGVVYCAADTYSKGLYDSFKTACEKYGVTVKETQSTASLDVQDYTTSLPPWLMRA
jgi:branched-chain amino acid transport system substrate-binding protein